MWPVLIVPCRGSTSVAPILLSFVPLFLSSLRCNLISLYGIFCCLFHVDLAGTLFLFFCCSPEAWGGTLLRLSPSFLKTSFVTSSRLRDFHWTWMFSWQWVWGLLPFQAFLGYPLGDLRVDFTKPFFMESPNRIAWHLMSWTIRFTFFVFVCMDRILAPSFLPHRTSPVGAALPSYRIVVKSWIICVFYYCLSIVIFCCCVVFYVVACATLVVGSCTMTYVIFVTLVVGSWALLFNQLGFLPTQFESFSMF